MLLLFLIIALNCNLWVCFFQCLTSRAAEAFSLLSSFGITQDINDECGKLASIETGQFLTALREREGQKRSSQQLRVYGFTTCTPWHDSLKFSENLWKFYLELLQHIKTIQPTFSGSLTVWLLWSTTMGCGKTQSCWILNTHKFTKTLTITTVLIHSQTWAMKKKLR